MPTYDGEPGPTLDFIKRTDKGDPANVSVLTLGSHTGTHVDAPSHFLKGGLTLDALPLDSFVGPALVVEFDRIGHINAADIDALAIPPDCTRVLFKTRNSLLWQEPAFQRDFTAVLPDAAMALAPDRRVLVGIDYLSIEPYGGSSAATHTAFLSAGCAILEGINLTDVLPGEYFLSCAPLRVVGAEGAPARAILIDGIRPLDRIG
jgi:arylformamidase